MFLKRPAAHMEPSSHASQPLPKRSRTRITIASGKNYRPKRKYQSHENNGVGKKFHSVPYPLTLLPYGSWCILHHRVQKADPPPHFTCPKCKKPRSRTSHQRKLFLVAERLSWDDNTVPSREKMENEEGLWEVNFELGILDPAVEESEQRPGGNKSRGNPFYPYETEEEAEAALTLLQQADKISDTTFKIWLDTVDAFSTMAANDLLKQKPINQREDRLVPLSIASGSQANARPPLLTPPSSLDALKGSEKAHSAAQAPSLQSLTAARCAEKGSMEPAFKTLMARVANGTSTVQDICVFKLVMDYFVQRITNEQARIGQKTSAPGMLQLPTPVGSSPQTSVEAVVNQYGLIFTSIPLPIFLKLAQTASISTFHLKLIDAVADRTATPHEHGVFKEWVDRCYVAYNTDLPEESLLVSADHQQPHHNPLPSRSELPPPSNSVDGFHSQPKSPVASRRQASMIGHGSSNPRVPINNQDHASTKKASPTEDRSTRSLKPTMAKYRCLPDSYCLLDKIERTSYMGMRFLETYAEYLKKDTCVDCWFKGNLMADEDFDDLEREVREDVDSS